jgi:hypothetical protein
MAIGSHPISFHLLDSNGNSVLGIFDGKGQTSKLEIKNTSRRDWLLKKLTSDVPSAQNHHFELKFRPGTLSDKSSIRLDGGTDWKMNAGSATPDGVSLYFLNTKSVTVKQDTGTFVMLQNLSADPTGGARGTRVQLKWTDKLEYVGTTPEPLPVGQRVQHLSIVNASGAKQIPLIVRIVSADRVVNDGTTTNTLKLRIASLLKTGNIELYPDKDPEYPMSKFVFRFDVPSTDADKEWTLATKSQLASITNTAVPAEITPGKDTQSASPSWWITPSKRFSLTPTNFIEVTLSNIVTSYPAGKANLYIHYENIPGYQDGNFVSLVEKSPVAFKEQNVGIGTTNAEKHLHVAGAGDQEVMIQSTSTNGVKWSLQSCGDSSGRFEIINRTTDYNRFTILKDGNVGIGNTDPKAKLHVNGNLRIEGDQEILFTENGQIRSADDNHRILFRRSDQKLELREYGSIIFSPGSSDGKETAKAVMLANGNVGIGTPQPEKHLHVKGAGDQEVMIESSDTGGVKWALQSSAGANEGRFEIINRTTGHNRFSILGDGKVGIGVAKPTRGILEVSGSVTTSVGGFGYLNKEKTNFPTNTQDCPFSIYADQRIGAVEFNAYSDGRMKSIQGRSDSAADLGTLLGIEITDYIHKDVIGKGAGIYKKVIGQQVAKVFPQAVSKHTDAIPDIYQQASIREGWVALSTELKKGDRVKLITEKGEDVHEVLDVTEDKFRVALDHEDDTVFVFGREVNDFLTVDYDAIAMLNVSATQQLKKELDQEVKALRAENAELRTTNDALAQRLQALESRLNAALNVVGAGNGSNGNGRH